MGFPRGDIGGPESRSRGGGAVSLTPPVLATQEYPVEWRPTQERGGALPCDLVCWLSG